MYFSVIYCMEIFTSYLLDKHRPRNWDLLTNQSILKTKTDELLKHGLSHVPKSSQDLDKI